MEPDLGNHAAKPGVKGAAWLFMKPDSALALADCSSHQELASEENAWLLMKLSGVSMLAAPEDLTNKELGSVEEYACASTGNPYELGPGFATFDLCSGAIRASLANLGSLAIRAIVRRFAAAAASAMAVAIESLLSAACASILSDVAMGVSLAAAKLDLLSLLMAGVADFAGD
jgi:hypothetical protein